MKLPIIAFGSTLFASGKFRAEAASSAFSGKVMGSLPEGFTLPCRMSATVLPPSWPACQAKRIASGRDFQLAVSITPPMLRITTAFFPSLWKASVTVLISSCSCSVKLKSPAMARSWNSPELRPIVMNAISASLALAATPAASGTNSGMRGWLKKAIIGLSLFGRFASSSDLYLAYISFTSVSNV